MADASKYEGEVDLTDRNNSRTLMIEMVGANKRVLEVGCATGYVSKVLTRRGCRVTGVEIDPEAATIAKEFCEEVLVGDVEELDLLETFGERSFEAILFGDVLEHLKDPLTLLRRCRHLLDPGGFVVVSVPNIAHGSVRLSLLRGQFDYRELGLLDETHLRFFTRESLERLFREAGLVVVEMQRTTAGVFEVEIPLSADAFPNELISEIERDPEATTYQFLAKAVLDNGQHAVAELHQRVEEHRLETLDLRRRIEELEQLLAQMEGESAGRLEEIESLRASKVRVEEENRSLTRRWAKLEARRLVRLYRAFQRLAGPRPVPPDEASVSDPPR